MLLSFLVAVFTSCNGQNENKSLAESNKSSTANGVAKDKPQINVKVNKQYDNKGNIIKFDSTYTYFYSSPKGSLRLGADSVFNSFHSFFEESYPNLIKGHSNKVFFNDSLFKYDFFNDDYFQRRFQLNEKMFENMYKQMDSIKRSFMKHNFPNGYTKKKTI